MDRRSMIRRPRALYLLPLLVWLSACAGEIPSGAYQKFSESLVQLHQGTDQALANIDQMSEDRFLREALEEPAKFLQLRIEINPTNPLAVFRVFGGYIVVDMPWVNGAHGNQDTSSRFPHHIEEFLLPVVGWERCG